MKFSTTELAGVVVVEPDVYRDERGFFLETYHAEKYRQGGIAATFVQDNHSRSGRGILRGLHAQCRSPQGKLVRVLAGEVFDVAVDIRRGSPSFARWVGVTLSAENFKQLYIPPGFAHGFYVTSEVAEVEYKCTALYDRTDEITIRWNDPQIAIAWPLAEPILSPRDRQAPGLAELAGALPLYAVE
jgi:dTDP-4-dehydrorhamnose 3,5-epimerase